MSKNGTKINNPKGKRRRLIAEHGPVCAICDETFDPEELTLDHIVPWTLGGDGDISNLRLACAPCNQIEGAWLMRDLNIKNEYPGAGRLRMFGIMS